MIELISTTLLLLIGAFVVAVIARAISHPLQTLHALRRLTNAQFLREHVSLPDSSLMAPSLSEGGAISIPPKRKRRIHLDPPPPLRLRVVSLVSIFSLLLSTVSPLVAPIHAASLQPDSAAGLPKITDGDNLMTPYGPFAETEAVNANGLTWVKPTDSSVSDMSLAPMGEQVITFQHTIGDWPADTDWIAYSYSGSDTQDQKIQDPSNGGTSPQNFVNVSSSCAAGDPDQVEPSTQYLYRDGIFYFRWRVEQIANTYATGPSPGSYGSTDPWKSALWTVFFDLDGGGWREFAVHIDGSSGTSRNPIDGISIIYGADKSQSLDYNYNPFFVTRLARQNAAVYDPNNNQLVNFNNNPDSSVWPGGSAATVWDYGSTRSTNVSNANCTEYYIDYQFPITLLNASALGGDVMTENTPFQMAFATANSLNNPL